jgi:hyaluronan synthase
LQNESVYLNQKFLGYMCNAGDDRHLTNIFLLNGDKVGWSKKSIAYTYSPPTLSQFHKQQLRWVRSHITSLWFIMQHLERWSPIFVFLNVKFLCRYIYMLSIYLGMIFLCTTYLSLWPVWTILFGITIVTLIKTIIAIIFTKKFKFFYLLMFSVYAFFVFNPLLFYGLFTPHKIGWYTRS